MEIIDQMNRVVSLKEVSFQRIISLVPSQTELLCGMGLRDHIVGLTKFCENPIGLKSEKNIIGGTKQINLEKIKTLKPDIILCNKEENTKEIVAECEAICPVHVSDIKTIEDSLVMIRQYGQMFDKEVVASQICLEIKITLADFTKSIGHLPRLKTAYFIWKKPWMVAASETFIDSLLQTNKFENVFSEINRYPIIELNDIPKDIELILLSSEPFPFQEKHITELAEQFPSAQIKLVDGAYFSWYGTRLIEAFDYFKELRKSIH